LVWIRARACLGIALVSAVLVFFWGAGDAANPDSATYIDGARHLARGEGWVTCRTTIESNAPGPIRAWPPGFSALMVPGIWLGLSPLESARVVLAWSFVAASVLVFLLARKVSGPRAALVPFLAVGLFALQPSQLYVVNRVLSDVPFVPSALLCVYLALRVTSLRNPSLWLKVALGAALVGMVLVRNAGLLMAAGIFAGLWLSVRGSSFVERARALLPVAATSALLFAPWMIRNQLVADNALGRAGIKVTEPFGHSVRAARGTVMWLTDAMESFGGFRIAAWLYAAGALALGVALVVTLVRTRLWVLRPLRLLGSVFTVYLCLMIVTATLHPFNDLDQQRFWVASWPLGLLLGLLVLRRARFRHPWLHRAAIGGMVLTLALYSVSFVRMLPKARQASGLLDREIAALAPLMPSKRRCRLVMNDPRPVLVHRELGPTSVLPRTRAAFDAALQTHPRLCVAVFGKHEGKKSRKSGGGRKKRLRGVPLVKALVESKRLELLVERPTLRVYEAVR
jgi:hypothetical protein